MGRSLWELGTFNLGVFIMLLHFRGDRGSYTLDNNLKHLRSNLQIEDYLCSYFWEIIIYADRNGVVKYFDFELIASPFYGIGTFDYLLPRLVNSGITGTYTVPELNIEEVTFPEVIKAVKRYYVNLSKKYYSFPSTAYYSKPAISTIRLQDRLFHYSKSI